MIPNWLSNRRASSTSAWAGLMLSRSATPDRSRKASSMDSGSTSGVKACISSRACRPTALYFAMSGRSTTASGHASIACQIGMAERTPAIRAT